MSFVLPPTLWVGVYKAYGKLTQDRFSILWVVLPILSVSLYVFLVLILLFCLTFPIHTPLPWNIWTHWDWTLIDGIQKYSHWYHRGVSQQGGEMKTEHLVGKGWCKGAVNILGVKSIYKNCNCKKIVDMAQGNSTQLSIHLLEYILLARGAGMEQKQMQR